MRPDYSVCSHLLVGRSPIKLGRSEAKHRGTASISIFLGPTPITYASFSVSRKEERKKKRKKRRSATEIHHRGTEDFKPISDIDTYLSGGLNRQEK